MAESPEDMEKRLKAQAKLGEDLRKSSAKMAGSMKDYLELQFRLYKSKNEEKELQKKINKLKEESNNITTDEIAEHQELLNKIKKENTELAKGAKVLKSQVLSVKNMSVAVSRDLLKGLKSVNKEIRKQSISYFEQEDTIRRMSVDIGIIGKQQQQLRKTVYKTSVATQQWGVGAAKLGEMYGSYVENVGRLIPLTVSAGKSLAAMSVGTALGAEGAAQMASNMEVFGMSIKSTAKYVEEVSNMSESMGVNSGKVLKTLNTNMKQAQTFNFKGGVKGMAKMAALSIKMRTSMASTLSFAQDLWEPEKAIEAGAALQMMGGAFAKMADPLQLMFNARNDPAKLMVDLATASASVVKNMGNGVYQIPTMELQKLKQVAEATGIPFEELVESGKTIAKQKDIGKMLVGGIQGKDREFIESIGTWSDAKGGFVVSTDGVTETLVKDLTSGMVGQMKSQAESLEKRAKDAQSTMTLFTNFFKSLKPLFYSFMEGLDSTLRKPIEALLGSGGKGLEGFSDTMREWGANMGTWIAGSLIPFMTKSIPAFVSSVKNIGKRIGEFFSGDGWETVKKAGIDFMAAGRMVWEGLKWIKETFGMKGILATILLVKFPSILKAAFSMLTGGIKGIGSLLGSVRGKPGSSFTNPMYTVSVGGGGGGGGGMGPHMDPSMYGGSKLGKKFAGSKMGKLVGGGFGRGKNMSLMKSLGKGGKAFGLLSIASMGMDIGRSFLSDPDGDTGKAMGVGGTVMGDAGTGAMLGSVIPGVGNLIGGLIGSVVGLGRGLYNEFSEKLLGHYDMGEKLSKHKNMGIGGSSTGRLADGTVSPSGNVIATRSGELWNTSPGDYISVSRPNGSNSTGGGGGSSNVNVSGTIKLQGGGVTVDLMENPIFISELTKKITEQMKTQSR